MRRWLTIILMLGPGALTSGCAHYYLPANHLDTPEAIGKGVGRLEWANLSTASDLNSFAQLPTPDPVTGEQAKAEVQKAYLAYSFGFVFRAGERMDLGIRLQPYVPPMLRFKYQFSGSSEAESQKGNWSASVASGAGLLLGQGAVQGESVSYYLIDLGVPVGYRAWERHLFSLMPFVNLAGISGTVLTAGYTNGPVKSADMVKENGLTQYGLALGYQYNVLALFLRTELAYLKGNLRNSELGGLFVGISTGLAL